MKGRESRIFLVTLPVERDATTPASSVENIIRYRAVAAKEAAWTAQFFT